MRALALFTVLVLLHPIATCNAQTVIQLPTVRNFGMSTTVSVPDRGRTYLGGIDRSYRNSTRRRLPLSPMSTRSLSHGTSSAGVSVSAFVHDFDAMDRAIREQAARTTASTRSNSVRSNSTRRVASTHHAGDEHQLPRVSDIRRQVTAIKADQYAKAATVIRAAVRLENAGKYAAARAKYRAAFANSRPEWQAKIRERVKMLDARLSQRTK